MEKLNFNVEDEKSMVFPKSTKFSVSYEVGLNKVFICFTPEYMSIGCRLVVLIKYQFLRVNILNQ